MYEIKEMYLFNIMIQYKLDSNSARKKDFCDDSQKS